MSFDLKVIGGTVVDGTGDAPRTADVGVRDGRIVEIGNLAGSAARTLDADGALVTPGFVDLHTHYDGQVSWDDALAPSSLHGVTTCLMGSCGVGFAPVREADHDRLIRLMEGVEDIPGTALSEGITWGWSSVPEYMDAIDRRPHTIDFGVQVPHDPLRVYVMGERAAADAPATEADVREMARVVAEALDAGAFGFSTGRTDNHRTAEGRPTPASEASQEELLGIAEVFRGRTHGVLQAVSDFDILRPADRFEPEWAAIEAMAEAAERPLSLSLMERDQDPEQWRRILAAAEAASARGLEVRVQVAPRPIGVILGFEATFHPFMGFPTYQSLEHLPLAERARRLQDPSTKARLLAEKHQPISGDGSAIPPLADLLLAQLETISKRMYPLTDPPSYEPDPRSCLYARSAATGRPVLEVLLDAFCEEDGRALIYFPLYNFTGLNLDHVHEMLTHPLALPGLSDGGAHVGTICDASFPTYLLQHWGRDRERGRIPIERLVRMQTRDTARFVGLEDRGTIEVGMRADLNVIDLDRLRLRKPHLVADLPAGGRRFLQRAEGYVATVVRGEVVAKDGALTEARPGRLVRLGR